MRTSKTPVDYPAIFGFHKPTWDYRWIECRDEDEIVEFRKNGIPVNRAATAARTLFDAGPFNHPHGNIPRWEDQPPPIKKAFHNLAHKEIS